MQSDRHLSYLLILTYINYIFETKCQTDYMVPNRWDLAYDVGL